METAPIAATKIVTRPLARDNQLDRQGQARETPRQSLGPPGEAAELIESTAALHTDKKLNDSQAVDQEHLPLNPHSTFARHPA